MTDDALSAAPEVVQSDVLTDQPEAPRAQEIKPQAEEPNPEPEAKAPVKSRPDVVKNAIEKVTKEPEAKPEEKAEPDPKAVKTEDRTPKAKAEEPKPEQNPTAYQKAPQRFDDAAKAEWGTVPESVRGAVHRTIKEAEQGIEKYRSAAEAYEPLRQYDDIARQSGGNLAQSLQRIVDIENAFQRSPVEGFLRVGQALGIDIRQVATQIAGLAPQQVNDHAIRMQMTDTQRENAQLRQHLMQQQQQSVAESEWQNFQQEFPRATELQSEIAEFLKKYPAGPNVPMRDRLADAYAFAAAKHPSAAHTGTETALAQTQAPRTANPSGQKSISGSARGEASSPKQKRSRSDAIRQAMRQHGAI